MPTVADFVPDSAAGSASDQQTGFVADADEKPNLLKHDPITYAGLTGQNALKTLWSQGLSPTGDDIKAIEKDALDRGQNLQADILKSQEQKNLELQQRALLTQRGKQGQPSQLETEKAQEAGVALKQKQLEQGQDAAAEAAEIEKNTGNPTFIEALPDDQKLRLEKLQTAYQTLNNMQALHKNMVDSAIGAGGNVRSVVGDLFRTDKTNQYARAYEAYQDESLTPLALGVLGDKAAGATKTNIQEQLKGTIPDRSDTLESAGNKIFMMKNNIMDQLNAMHDQNQGRYATYKISSLYQNLDKDFSSDAVQNLNVFKPINQNQPVVNVGNTPGTKEKIAAAAVGNAAPTLAPTSPLAGGVQDWATGSLNPPAATPAATPAPTPSLQNLSQFLPGYGGT